MDDVSLKLIASSQVNLLPLIHSFI